MVSGLRIEGGTQILPARVRKTIQSIKEIVGDHSDADIYTTLKETNMDPNETAQKLLNQGISFVTLGLIFFAFFFLFSWFAMLLALRKFIVLKTWRWPTFFRWVFLFCFILCIFIFNFGGRVFCLGQWAHASSVGAVGNSKFCFWWFRKSFNDDVFHPTVASCPVALIFRN